MHNHSILDEYFESFEIINFFTIDFHLSLFSEFTKI